MVTIAVTGNVGLKLKFQCSVFRNSRCSPVSRRKGRSAVIDGAGTCHLSITCAFFEFRYTHVVKQHPLRAMAIRSGELPSCDPSQSRESDVTEFPLEAVTMQH